MKNDQYEFNHLFNWCFISYIDLQDQVYLQVAFGKSSVFYIKQKYVYNQNIYKYDALLYFFILVLFWKVLDDVVDQN